MNGTSKCILENLKSTILDQVPAIIIAVDREFNLLYLNGAACKFLGKSSEHLEGDKCYDNFDTQLCNTGECPVRKAMDTGHICQGQTEKQAGDTKAMIEYVASPLRNDQGDIIGAVEYLVDVTEKVAAEERSRRLERDILELSTPVLTLWEDILAVPLIGTLDSRRTQDAMEKALTRMAQDKAEVLIVDITGVPVMDTMVANYLIRMSDAVRLMGGECILTGISPSTAKTIVHLGIDLSNLNTCATLSQGLKSALKFSKKAKAEL